MHDRQKTALGFALGVIWALLLLWFGAQIDLPVFTLVPTVMMSFLAPGCVMVAMLLGRQVIEVAPAVIAGTAEQLLLALCIWPGAAVILAGHGPGLVAALSGGFVLARLLFWFGYRFQLLRDIGVWATLLPTVLAAGWAILTLVM